VSTHGEAVTGAKLQEQGETIELLQRLGMLTLAPVVVRTCRQATACLRHRCRDPADPPHGARRLDVAGARLGVEANDIDLDVARRKMYWTT